MKPVFLTILLFNPSYKFKKAFRVFAKRLVPKQLVWWINEVVVKGFKSKVVSQVVKLLERTQ